LIEEEGVITGSKVIIYYYEEYHNYMIVSIWAITRSFSECGILGTNYNKPPPSECGILGTNYNKAPLTERVYIYIYTYIGRIII